ncbi:hypothetical protein DFR76_104343 [Nocardia pseudobrasiliensis]|uniref:Excreted virulence factor EspC (Type VII ESX diderm) n=1 Tax=Nocardia pseudobrasiliensis TaxID=45979 RepID=A0A370I791_9NOCA|nr:hypothetical protein DFR76_104343 [Nocardia pseudobrasiliensis]
MAVGVSPDEWKRLLAQANDKQLALDPEVGRGLDRVCDDHIGRLQQVLDLIGGISRITGFGDFPSGTTLAAKFSHTAAGTDRSLETMVQQHIDTVNTVKEVLAKAISNFTTQDQSSATAITSTEVPQ